MPFGSPRLTAASPLARPFQRSLAYRAEKTPVRIQPAVTLRPSDAVAGALRALSRIAARVAFGSGPIGQPAPLALQSAAKSSYACAKPFAWPSAALIGPAVGSTAPSSTMARMLLGKSWAYVAPSSVPYEKPRQVSFGSPT